MRYQIFHNQTAGFWRPYEPGDVLVPGFEGDLGWPSNINEPGIARAAAQLDPTAYAERVFEIHNRDDRPDRYNQPSLSVGDVVVLGEVALSVDRIGWKEVRLCQPATGS